MGEQLTGWKVCLGSVSEGSGLGYLAPRAWAGYRGGNDEGAGIRWETDGSVDLKRGRNNFLCVPLRGHKHSDKFLTQAAGCEGSFCDAG